MSMQKRLLVHQVWQLQRLEPWDWAVCGASTGLRTTISLVLGAGWEVRQEAIHRTLQKAEDGVNKTTAVTRATNAPNAASQTKRGTKRCQWRCWRRRSCSPNRGRLYEHAHTQTYCVDLLQRHIHMATCTCKHAYRNVYRSVHRRVYETHGRPR